MFCFLKKRFLKKTPVISQTDGTCGRLQDGVNVGKSPCPRVPGTAGADELAMGPDSKNKAKEPEQVTVSRSSLKYFRPDFT